MMMSDWLSPNPPHITEPLLNKRREEVLLELGIKVEKTE